MPHLFVAAPWSEANVDLPRDMRRHLEKVLRLDAPAEVTYTDGLGTVGSGVFEGSSIKRGIEEQRPRPSRLTIAVAPPKNNARLRFVVEKLAEIGVERLVWLETEYGEGKPPRAEKALAWAIAALEQSRGAWLMDIVGFVPIAGIAELGTPLLADHGGERFAEIQPVSQPVLCIGPEGGFAIGELPDQAQRVSLGPTVLRVETAAVVGATILLDVLRR